MGLGILLIPFISTFISPDEEQYPLGELATVVVGNNIFFGVLVAVGLVIVGYLVWKLVRKKRKK